MPLVAVFRWPIKKRNLFFGLQIAFSEFNKEYVRQLTKFKTWRLGNSFIIFSLYLQQNYHGVLSNRLRLYPLNLMQTMLTQGFDITETKRAPTPYRKWNRGFLKS